MITTPRSHATDWRASVGYGAFSPGRPPPDMPLSPWMTAQLYKHFRLDCSLLGAIAMHYAHLGLGLGLGLGSGIGLGLGLS